jgi:nucleotide-binding universal stress UspA family protein
VRKLAHHDREGSPRPAEIRDILYATDLKHRPNRAIASAISLAREFHARLGLLHVIDDYGDRLHEQPGPIDLALRELRELVPEDAGLQYAPEALAQFGMPAESILQTAAEREADLIILGARPANGYPKATTHLGSGVAHRIIVGANCPVLTVRS